MAQRYVDRRADGYCSSRVRRRSAASFARGIARQPERLGDRRAEQRIAERVQHQRERALGDLMSSWPTLSWATRPRIESRIGIERVAVAGEDHPGGERAGAFLPNASKVWSTMTRASASPARARSTASAMLAVTESAIESGELGLKAGRRAEMVEQIGVGPADLRRRPP